MQPDGLMQQQNGNYIPQAVNRIPTVVDQDQIRQRQNDQDRIEAENEQRKGDLGGEREAAQAGNRSESKTDKDTLSVGRIRRIDAIQKGGQRYEGQVAAEKQLIPSDVRSQKSLGAIS